MTSKTQDDRLAEARAALALAEQFEAETARRVEAAQAARKQRPRRKKELEAQQERLLAEEKALAVELENSIERRIARNMARQAAVRDELRELNTVTPDALEAAGPKLAAEYRELTAQLDDLNRKENNAYSVEQRDEFARQGRAVSTKIEALKTRILFGS
jgi:hypothetical protein